MMLRGPQTLSELKTRTERYEADLDDMGGVEGVLERLAARPEPLVVLLGRQPGQREDRYAQLLGGPPDLERLSAASAVPSRAGQTGWTSWRRRFVGCAASWTTSACSCRICSGPELPAGMPCSLVPR